MDRVDGRTLTLADVSWQEAAVDPTDGYDIPIRYTAVASYTGTATSKYATGYTVTADYKGDVTRTSCDTVIYTAVFSSVGNAAVKTGRSNFNWLRRLNIFFPTNVESIAALCR